MKNESWFDSITGALVGSHAGAIILGVAIALLVQWRTGMAEVVFPRAPLSQAMPLWILGAGVGIIAWWIFLVVVIEVVPRLRLR